MLSANSFRLLDAVWLDRNRDGKFGDDERVTTTSGAGVVLSAPDGKQFRADLAAAGLRPIAWRAMQRFISEQWIVLAERAD